MTKMSKSLLGCGIIALTVMIWQGFIFEPPSLASPSTDRRVVLPARSWLPKSSPKPVIEPPPAIPPAPGRSADRVSLPEIQWWQPGNEALTWRLGIEPRALQMLGLTEEETFALSAVMTEMGQACRRLEKQVVKASNSQDKSVFFVPSYYDNGGKAVEEKWLRDLAAAVGSERARYIVSSSKYEMEVANGAFGKQGRMVRILPLSPDMDGSNEGAYQAEVWTGDINESQFTTLAGATRSQRFLGRNLRRLNFSEPPPEFEGFFD
jgi:hypothetical protein